MRTGSDPNQITTACHLTLRSLAGMVSGLRGLSDNRFYTQKMAASTKLAAMLGSERLELRRLAWSLG